MDLISLFPNVLMNRITSTEAAIVQLIRRDAASFTFASMILTCFSSPLRMTPGSMAEASEGNSDETSREEEGDDDDDEEEDEEDETFFPFDPFDPYL